jgi:hypothetical protein
VAPEQLTQLSCSIEPVIAGSAAQKNIRKRTFTCLDAYPCDLAYQVMYPFRGGRDVFVLRYLRRFRAPLKLLTPQGQSDIFSA